MFSLRILPLFLCASALLTGAEGVIEFRKLNASPAPAMGYAYWIPVGFGASSAKYPVIVHLGGTGERGDGITQSNLDTLLNNGPLNMLRPSGGHQPFKDLLITYPALVVQPQLVTNGNWNSTTLDQLRTVITTNLDTQFGAGRIDRDRIWMTGFSLGGGGTWLYARLFGNELAGIMPVAGASSATALMERFTSLPIWAFHCWDDTVVTRAFTRDWLFRIVSTWNGATPTDPSANFPGGWNTQNASDQSATYSLNSGWTWQSGIHAPTTFVPGVTIHRTSGHNWTPAMRTTMAGWTWLFAQSRLNRPFSSGIVVDNGDTTVSSTGTWNLSTSDGPYLGNVRLATGGSGATFTLPAEIPSNGSYRVYLRWTTPAANPTTTRSNAVPVDIVHAGGTSTVTVNQQTNGGTWVDLGQFNFTASGDVTITIRTNGLPTTITVSADAIRIVPVDALSITAVSPTSGPTGGGTVVTLTGTGFDAGATVSVGGIAASGVTVVNATTITVTTPAISAGSASITVTSGGATYTRSGAFVVTGAGGPPANSAPTITVPSAPASLSTTEDVAQTLSVTATDPNAGQTLTWTISASPSKGTVTGTGTGTSRTLTYTPNLNANGADSFTVQVADGAGGTATRPVTVSISPVNDPPVNTALPSVSGTLQVGSALSSTSGTWTDAKDANPGPITYAYRWRRADNSGGTNLTIISGATGTTYTLTNSELGKFIDVLVTATDSGAPGTATDSSAAVRTAAITAPTPNSPPVITAPASPATLTTSEDTAQTLDVTATDADAGQTLTWTISANPTKGTVSGTGTGASLQLTYTPNDQANGADSFTVQVSDGLASTTRAVTVDITPVNDAPVNTALPTISGIPEINQTLRATTGTWTDAKDANPGPINYAYQWRKADTIGGTNLVNIAGATSPTLTLTTNELGKFIDVLITATDSGAPGTASATSAAARTTGVSTIGVDPGDDSGSGGGCGSGGGLGLLGLLAACTAVSRSRRRN